MGHVGKDSAQKGVRIEMDTTEHVADATEELQMLPQSFLVAQEMVKRIGVEPIWLVDESTGKIERGSMIDTETSQYYTFELVQLGEELTVVPTSEWLPCPTD
jgi:hypothetical protein